MIKFEYGMLVLDNNTTKEDVDAVKDFADNVRKQETERIIKLLVNHLLDESIWKPRTELEKNRKQFYARGIQNAIALIKGENK